MGSDYPICVLSPKNLQEMAESFLMMTKCVGNSVELFDPFELEKGFDFDKKDLVVLDQMTSEIITWLVMGSLKDVGAVAECYWDRWARKLGGASPTESSYQKARVAGAYGGFPVDWDATTYCLLAPKEKHDRIKAMMPEWTALPYTITPFGARICGTF